MVKSSNQKKRCVLQRVLQKIWNVGGSYDEDSGVGCYIHICENVGFAKILFTDCGKVLNVLWVWVAGIMGIFSSDWEHIGEIYVLFLDSS